MQTILNPNCTVAKLYIWELGDYLIQMMAITWHVQPYLGCFQPLQTKQSDQNLLFLIEASSGDGLVEIQWTEIKNHDMCTANLCQSICMSYDRFSLGDIAVWVDCENTNLYHMLSEYMATEETVISLPIHTVWSEHSMSPCLVLSKVEEREKKADVKLCNCHPSKDRFSGKARHLLRLH